jgi:hypothetical protein
MICANEQLQSHEVWEKKFKVDACKLPQNEFCCFWNGRKPQWLEVVRTPPTSNVPSLTCFPWNDNGPGEDERDELGPEARKAI